MDIKLRIFKEQIISLSAKRDMKNVRFSFLIYFVF